MTRRRPTLGLARKARQALHIPFKKEHFVASALVHPSYRNEAECPKLLDFDRLEFFGDSILNYVICRKVYEVFPEADEGFMSRMRSVLVSRKVLSRIAARLRLGRHIKIGKSLRQQGRQAKAKILADTLEAVIAAIYFDQGLRRAERFILKNYDGYFDARKLFRLDPNPKSTLQELCQKNWQRLPHYHNEKNRNGMKTVITVHGRLKAMARAKTRKEAEEKAARVLIRRIRQVLLRSKKKSSSRKLRKIL